MVKLGEIAGWPAPKARQPIVLTKYRTRTLTCAGKRMHRSQGAAEAALRSLVKRGLDRPEEGRLHTYQCKRCLCFHVGHTTREA